MEGGFASGMNNLFQNKMFLQYLSAAGGAMSAGQPLGPALNQVTQQNISSQNQLGLLKKMLGGYPTGTKMGVDEKGVSLKIPHQQEQQGGIQEQTLNQASPEGPGLNQAPQAQPVQAQNLQQPDMQNNVLSSMLGGGDPLAGVSASDMAGLAPADISNALSLKLAFGNQKLDALELMRKMQPQPIDMAPLEVPGIGQMTLEQFNALDTKAKGYAYYAHDAKNRGEQVMSLNDWANQTPEAVQLQYYKASKQDPEFKNYLLEMAKAGSTNISIGDQVKLAADKARATGEVAQELDVKSPDFVNKVRNDIMKDKAKWMLPDDTVLNEIKSKYKITDDNKATEIYQRALLIEELDKRIMQKYPNAVIKNGGWYNGAELIRSLP